MAESQHQPLITDEDLERLRKIFTDHPVKNKTTSNSHSKIREACLDLAITISYLVPPGRERSLALTHLEEVMMWANAGIARNS